MENWADPDWAFSANSMGSVLAIKAKEATSQSSGGEIHQSQHNSERSSEFNENNIRFWKSEKDSPRLQFTVEGAS